MTHTIAPAERPMTEERLAEIHAIVSTPAEVTTGAHAATQSALASSVPELLAEIGLLRLLIHSEHRADITRRLADAPGRRKLRAALGAWETATYSEEVPMMAEAGQDLAAAVRAYLEEPT